MAREHVFISYCHADRKWLVELRPYLKPYEKKNRLAVWDDTRMKTGALWKDEIKRALDLTKVAVLLVTQHFMASDFIQDEELPHFLAASKKEGLVILWVAVSASTYKDSPLVSFQAANDPARPLDTLRVSERKREWVGIAGEIRDAMDP